MELCMSYQVQKLDARLVNLVNEYLNGSSVQDLSAKYKLPPEQISEFLSKQEVKNYIATTLANSGYINPLNRIRLLNQMIEQKIQLAEEANIPLTSKDITELIKLLQEEQKILQKNTDTPAVQVNIQAEYVSLIEELVKKDPAN